MITKTIKSESKERRAVIYIAIDGEATLYDESGDKGLIEQYKKNVVKEFLQKHLN